MSDARKGIIIYAPEDIEKNKGFVRICAENLRNNKIELKLVVLQNKNQEDIRECMDWERERPDFAINRSRNAVIAKQLETEGVRVFNRSAVTEIGNDKWKTYLYARRLGIPVMNTCKNSGDTMTFPKVIKSCTGHGGNEVFLVRNVGEEKMAVSRMKGDYIVQELADAKGRDIRVYILGGDIAVAMCRSAADGFKSNFSLGGTSQEYSLNAQEEELVRTIMKDLRPDYAGIDFFYDGEHLVLNEIEDAVGARMVYENTGQDIVKAYAEYIAGQISNNL